MLRTDSRRKLQFRPALRIGEVGLKSPGQLLYPISEDRIGGHLRESQIRGLRQQSPRIALALFPDSGIEIAKDLDAIGSPTPPVIPSQRLEGLQRRRQFSPARSRHWFDCVFRFSRHALTNRENVM